MFRWRECFEIEQALQVKQWGADGVIVGSAFVQRLATDSPTEGLQAVEELCQELKEAVSTPFMVGSRD